MTTTIIRPDAGTALATRIRLADGRLFDGTLPVERHRSIHLGLLHADSDGYVELAAGPRIAGRLRVTTRKDPGHFLPGGASAAPSWLRRAARARRAARDGGRRGVRRPRGPRRAWREQGARPAHPLAVDRCRRSRRPAGRPRAAAPQAGAARDRVRGIRGRALLLAAARPAARGGDRARARAPDLRARLRVARRPARADGRRSGVQGPLAGHAARRHAQRQERPAGADRVRGPRPDAVDG